MPAAPNRADRMPVDENDSRLTRSSLSNGTRAGKQSRMERVEFNKDEDEDNDGDEDEAMNVEPKVNDAHSALKSLHRHQRQILRNKLIQAANLRELNENTVIQLAREGRINHPAFVQVTACLTYPNVDPVPDSDPDGPSSGIDSDPMEDRSDGEAEAIKYEITQLFESVPPLLEKYKIVDRLGEGTFSSVYKAVDLCHSFHDNSEWHDTSRSNAGKVYVALKRIYVTSSPIRIQNELEILHDLQGSKNIAYLIEALRWEDQVVAVMPFNRHQDFRDWYRVATMPMLRSYFACLFRALSSTHRQHIIHRDVKPANFLYDFTQGTGVLCDYGLAQKIGGEEWVDWKSDCLHSLPGPSWGGLKGREWATDERIRYAPDLPPGIYSGLHGVRLDKPMELYDQLTLLNNKHRWALKDVRSEDHSDKSERWREIVDNLEEPFRYDKELLREVRKKSNERKGFRKEWRPASEVVAQRGAGEKIGYLKEDRRPHTKANRAGTRGFRAPEVLLKCPDQTVAIDIWSVGIILLCFLTRRFPFFNSNDDTEALAEIATIFGKRRMERCSALHNRTFLTNIPDISQPVHAKLSKLVKSLNPSIFVENSPNPMGPIPSTDASDEEWYEGSELSLAIDLLKRCLELDCTKRWTAEECLEHPFFDSGLYDVGMHQLAPRDDRYTPVFAPLQSVPFTGSEYI